MFTNKSLYLTWTREFVRYTFFNQIAYIDKNMCQDPTHPGAALAFSPLSVPPFILSLRPWGGSALPRGRDEACLGQRPSSTPWSVSSGLLQL